MRLWRYKADWGQPIIETLAWLTDIRATRAGTEQRTRLREHPRRAMSFSTVTIGRPKRDIDADLWGAGVEGWIVPLWWDAAFPRTVIGNAEFVGVNLDQGRDFQVGQYVAVMKGNADRRDDVTGDEDWDFFEITTIFDGAGDDRHIAVDGPIPAHLQDGPVVIYPAFSAALTGAEVESVTATAATASASFELIDYRSPAGASPFGQYLDLDLFDDRPDRQRPEPVTYDRMIDTIDYGLGRVTRYDDPLRPFLRRDRDFVYVDRDDLWDRRRWLHSIGGAHGSFWSPTWDRDLVVVGLSGFPAGTELQVEPIKWADRYGGEPGRDVIYLRIKGEDPVVRNLDSNSGDFEDGYEILYVDAIDAFDAADVIGCSWLERVRLSGDVVEIEHVAQGKARINLPMVVLDDDL